MSDFMSRLKAELGVLEGNIPKVEAQVKQLLNQIEQWKGRHQAVTEVMQLATAIGVSVAPPAPPAAEPATALAAVPDAPAETPQSAAPTSAPAGGGL